MLGTVNLQCISIGEQCQSLCQESRDRSPVLRLQYVALEDIWKDTAVRCNDLDAKMAAELAAFLEKVPPYF